MKSTRTSNGDIFSVQNVCVPSVPTFIWRLKPPLKYKY